MSGIDGAIVIATLGGVLELDGEYYGLTVSHAFLSSKHECHSSSLSREHDSESAESELGSDIDNSSFTFDEDDLDPFVHPLRLSLRKPKPNSP